MREGSSEPPRESVSHWYREQKSIPITIKMDSGHEIRERLKIYANFVIISS
jgi:hypothetical protein